MSEPAEPSSLALPRGARIWRALNSDSAQEYILYLPQSAGPRAPVLVSLHGLSRNAHEHAATFTSACDEHGAVMVVPIFTEEVHKDYQRLGRKGRGERADLMLHRVLTEVESLTRADTSKLFLFGFSGGAQFAHRYLMAHPGRVARAVVAGSGWYTFPDTRQRFPYGIRPVRTLEGVAFDPEQFLRIPVQVIVGTEDTQLHNVRSTERTVAQQGATRLDRARNWVAAMRKAAEAHSLPPLVTLGEIQGIGHSFGELCQQGALAQRVGQFLFANIASVARTEPSGPSRVNVRVG